MRRITIFAAAILLLSPFVAEAQEAARIGILRLTAPPPHYVEQLRAGLRDRGHVEGKTFVIVPGWGKRGDKGVPLAKKLVAQGVDVIVTDGTVTARAARKAAPSTPIVMASAGDPVRSKLVHSLAAPGGNITGLMSGSVAQVPKRLEILKEIVPGLRRVGNFTVSRRRTSLGIGTLFAEARKRAGLALDLEFVRVDRRKGENWADVVARFKAAGVDALSVRGTPFFTLADRQEIVEAALRFRLPAIFRTAEYVRMGGLVSYATDRGAMYRRAAVYVDKILKGAKPADLPVERPTKFVFAINLKTAKALGITVPASILLRATEVIE